MRLIEDRRQTTKTGVRVPGLCVSAFYRKQMDIQMRPAYVTKTKKSHDSGPIIHGPYISAAEARARLAASTVGRINFRGPDGCFLWVGATNRDGYPCNAVHRRVWERLVGPIPEGLELDHYLRCSRSCVFPGHLRACTHAENMANSIRALQTHCLHGHRFSPANTYRRPSGGRTCRTCNRHAVAQLRERKRARSTQLLDAA